VRMRISPDDVLAILTTRSIQKKNNVYKMYLALYILTLIVTLTEGFYLPGLAPVVYCEKSANNKKCQVKMMPFALPQESEVLSIIRHRGAPRRSLGNYKKNTRSATHFWGVC